MRVLLVDDEKELVSTLAERLGYRGVSADWVTRASEALSKAEKNAYDIAVLDIKMPETDGFKLKRQLKKNNPQMKFIFLTGHGSENYYHIGSAETGKDFYLVKPVEISRLIEKFNEAIKKQGTP
ncbi:MAG: response regulator [Desulfatitalea sp.]|nr:response regulator [Desulfatitalea sp.]NNK01053.1 response regulator [Desulfatitalea sp.]